jgi:hypothetical protein
VPKGGNQSPSPRQKEGGRRRHHANRREADVVTAPWGRLAAPGRRHRCPPARGDGVIEEGGGCTPSSSRKQLEEGGGCMLSSSWKQRRGRRKEDVARCHRRGSSVVEGGGLLAWTTAWRATRRWATNGGGRPARTSPRAPPLVGVGSPLLQQAHLLQ